MATDDALGTADGMTVGDNTAVATSVAVGVQVRGVTVGELTTEVAFVLLSATLAMTTGACV